MKKITLLLLFLSLYLVGQAIVSKTVNITAGGLLSTLTTTELSTVTNLTIAGTIDARDFVTMRDKMPVLAVLDISTVNIAAYNGNDGTFTDTLYPANTLPEYSFYNQANGQGKTSLTTITIPSSVTSIGTGAFESSGLTSVTIPNSVTSILQGTFYGCSSLTTITIPSSVTSIGDETFGYCSGLTSIHIPSSVTSIGTDAFAYCSGLTTISIPSSVTSISQSTFYGCSGLTSIDIPSSVTSIGDYVFVNCKDLTSITIPSSVTSIGTDAFAYCSGLTSISIPSSVTSIRSVAFGYCSGLTSIYTYATTPVDLSLSADVFTGVNTSTCILYVPSGSLNAYQGANQWKVFTHIVGMTNTGVSSEIINPIYLYPNPVTDGFFIKGLNGNGTLALLDISGKMLLTKQVSGNEYVSLSTFSKGLYIVKITSAEGTIERKLLKE